MNKTHEEFLQKINVVYDDIINSDMNDILDIDYLTNAISKVGLYNEFDRRHPENNDVHLYEFTHHSHNYKLMGIGLVITL